MEKKYDFGDEGESSPPEFEFGVNDESSSSSSSSLDDSEIDDELEELQFSMSLPTVSVTGIKNHSNTNIKHVINNNNNNNNKIKFRDWNKEFQECLELPFKTLEQQIHKIKSIKFITFLMEQEAKKIAKQIVSEIHLLDTDLQKQYHPSQDLGVAGGVKYLIGGMFIKLLTDNNNLYSTDEFAMKTANHEIQYIKLIHDIRIENLSLPWACTVDYLGFRLFCTSLLPISSYVN